MKLLGKVTLVTGGNSGIGRAIALRAAAEGARVAITGRDPHKGAQVLAELQAAGADALFLGADLGDEAEAAGVVAEVARRFGGLDIVVNNAGSGARRTPILAADGPGERLRKIMHANLNAAYHTAAHAIPLILASIFVVGLTLAIVYEKTKSTIATMTLHSLFNTIGVIAVFIDLSNINFTCKR